LRASEIQGYVSVSVKPPVCKDIFLMKQGTLKTLGVMALGAAALVAGGGVASAAGSAPGPHGPGVSSGLGGQGVGVSAPQGQLPGQAQAPGTNAGRPAANRPSQPDAQGLLGSLGGLGGLKNSLPTNGIMRLG
jgi:hypothetical protein